MSSALEVQATTAVPRLRAPAGIAGRCRVILLLTTITALMAVVTALTMVLALVTLFRARRLYTEVMGKWFARAALRVCGVKVVVHQDAPLPATQLVFISNHTSTLDTFVLPALGLRNCRFFLSGFLRMNPLICIMGYLAGNFWTVPQTFPARRTRIFQRAEHILRRTGESVYLSPEGGRIATGQIGHFNKGAFHLATNLGAPLLPLYIAIPVETNPGLGFDVRPGVVHVFFRPPISTRDWKIEDLGQNRDSVHDYFVDLHEELKPR